jgi:YD repeat-containing protein
MKEKIKIIFRDVKILSVSTVFLLFITSCDLDLFSSYEDSPLTTESLRTNRVELDLKGNVKSYSIIVYKAIESSGNVIEGEVVGSIKSVFNTDGNKIEFNKYESFGRLIYNTSYNYNSEGRIIESNESDTLGLRKKNIYSYNLYGSITQILSSDVHGNQSFKRDYIYDDMQNNIEENKYSSDGSWWKTKYKFDGIGNKIEETSSDSWTSKNGKTTFKYDNKRNNIERSLFNFEGELTFKNSFIYNSRNFIIEDFDLFSRYGNSARSKHIYKYDNKDNLLENFRYSLKNNIQYRNAYEYEYDLQSNWLTKLEIVNGVTEFIAKREIEYF